MNYTHFQENLANFWSIALSFHKLLLELSIMSFSSCSVVIGLNSIDIYCSKRVCWFRSSRVARPTSRAAELSSKLEKDLCWFDDIFVMFQRRDYQWDVSEHETHNLNLKHCMLVFEGGCQLWLLENGCAFHTSVAIQLDLISAQNCAMCGVPD